MDTDTKIARKKVKRTESYKIATNRKHSIDDLDVTFLGRSVHSNTERTRNRALNLTSLPTRLKSTNHKSKSVHELNSDNLSHHTIQERSASAKSFTDDTQRSISSRSRSSDKIDLKRSSSAKSHTNDTEYQQLSTFSKSHSSKEHQQSTSFQPHLGEKRDPQRSASAKSHSSDKSDPHRSGSQKSGTVASSDTDEDRRSVTENRKKKGVFRRMKERLLQTFRKSTLRENDREVESYKKDNEVSSRINNNNERQFFQITGLEADENYTDLNRDHLISKEHGRSTPIEIQFEKESSIQHEDVDNSDDDDRVTKIFDNLINPATPFLRLHNKTAPDKSKLTLDGLEKFRPKSIEKQHLTSVDREWFRHTYRENMQNSEQPRMFPLTSDAESLGMSDSSVHYESDFEDLLYNNNRQKLYDFGRRFATIADRLVDNREREQQNTRQPSIDRSDRTLSDGNFKKLGEQGENKYSILPIITNLAAAQEYREFHQIILRELSRTSHWEQVAWYTYLMKSTLSVIGTGRDLGRRVQSYANRYFNRQLRSWIESRPNGWESIYEETDVEDSELD